MPRIAINGFGRIGRNILRAIYEQNVQDEFEVVAINDLGSPAINAHLLKHDTVHGTFSFDVEASEEGITVAGNEIKILAERNPTDLPWGDMNVDIVYECTGLFVARDKAAMHLQAGAKNVLISAPGKEVDLTVVYGVNHESVTAEHKVISNASCTTNCLAPMTYAIHKAIGVETGLMNTIHSYTNDQRVTDSYHSDMLRARAAAHNMIPTKTGAAAAIGLVIPELKGKLDGLAVRVPTINVSCLDFTFKPSRATTAEEVNQVISEAAEGRFKGIMDVNALPLVSGDFNHNPASCIFDLSQTRVIGDQVKVLAWYDNEWGFSNRMLDTSRVIFAANN
ncbi:type I glyceraldehyde-3-phosphate dehydrogenase [Agarilytica rhodophyticola]|uniref:type I glyceraldehyde-3-phosphate dehydrogenase n=1 Tax=Agarilytica rhodophyticola TaxID=1737490 RepID=UPI000B343E91|nr:type I glyceraldehyde-3-phosphate dehydrogenase [Agarilytica rhodophyticola]